MKKHNVNKKFAKIDRAWCEYCKNKHGADSQKNCKHCNVLKREIERKGGKYGV